MGAAVGEVHAPFVDLERDADQRADAVDREQGVAPAGSDPGEVVADAGRGLGGDETA